MFGFVLPQFYPCSNLTSNHIFQMAWNHHLLEVIYVYDSPNMMIMMMMMIRRWWWWWWWWWWRRRRWRWIWRGQNTCFLQCWSFWVEQMTWPSFFINLLWWIYFLEISQSPSLLQVIPKRWRQRLALRVRSEGCHWTWPVELQSSFSPCYRVGPKTSDTSGAIWMFPKIVGFPSYK